MLVDYSSLFLSVQEKSVRNIEDRYSKEIHMDEPFYVDMDYFEKNNGCQGEGT